MILLRLIIYVAQIFTLYILKMRQLGNNFITSVPFEKKSRTKKLECFEVDTMTDLGFIKTISEEDDVPLAAESTDSDEEVHILVKRLIIWENCDS